MKAAQKRLSWHSLEEAYIQQWPGDEVKNSKKLNFNSPLSEGSDYYRPVVDKRRNRTPTASKRYVTPEFYISNTWLKFT